MGISDLLPDRELPDETPGSLFAGTILDDAADVGDQVRVRLNVDGDQFIGPMPFMPRGDLLPAEGDRALVAFDDDGRPWLVAWTEG